MRKPMLAILASMMLTSAPAAIALPQMDITTAKGTLTQRAKTATGAEFKSRRLRDQPSFDKLGIGNYFAEYRLDAGQKLQVWMYVESAPPIVDEVVVYIYPAKPADVTFDRALKLLNIVYGESNQGSKVVSDFKDARANKLKNQYKEDSKTYQQGSLLPTNYDGSLYYVGKSFGYKVSYHKGGVEVGVYRKDYWQKFIMDVKARRFPDPKPVPKVKLVPTPKVTPQPKIVW